jgi:hypothetical protein
VTTASLDRARGAGIHPRLQQALALTRDDLSRGRGAGRAIDLTVVGHWSTPFNEVARLRVSGSDEDDVFVKLAGPGTDPSAIEREAAATARFREVFSPMRPRFDSVELVASHPAEGLLTVRACRGLLLSDALRAVGGWRSGKVSRGQALSMVRTAGEWLRFLEEATLGAAGPLEARQTLLNEADRAETRIRGCFASPALNRLVAVCRRRIEAIETTGVQVYLAHGDFHPGNLFVTGDEMPRVTAIDLGLAGPRFVGYDALGFEHQVLHAFGFPRLGIGTTTTILRSFRRGYGRTFDRVSRLVQGLRAHAVLASLAYTPVLEPRASAWRGALARLDLLKLRVWSELVLAGG